VLICYFRKFLLEFLILDQQKLFLLRELLRLFSQGNISDFDVFELLKAEHLNLIFFNGALSFF
jgi:hypothetical protein